MRLSLCAILLVLTVGLLLGGSTATAAEKEKPDPIWPMFRGNALQTGVATAKLPDKLEVLWQFKTQDSVESTAAIAKGVVYIGSNDLHLYAIDLAKGTEKWKYKAGPFKAAPSLRNGSVFVGDGDGMFHCIDVESGKKRWTFETEGEIVSGANFAGDNVLFGSGDEHLYCLSKDGKTLWKFQVPGGPVMAAPAIVNDRTFVAGCDSALHVINIKDGKEERSVELTGQVGATAAILGEHLYIGTMTNQVLAINWKKGEVSWTYEAATRQHSFFASCAVTDALVIAASRDKRVHALNRKTGAKVWLFETEDRVDSSPVVVGSRVYFGSFDGHLYAVDLETGKELQKIKLDGRIASSPAVAENCLVISTTKGTVYCLGAKK